MKRSFAAISQSILDLLQQIYSINESIPGKIYIAYSGGIDSAVLLHACAELQQNNLLSAPLASWHINHQLSEAAAKWQQHCAHQSELLGIPFRANIINLRPAAKESLEMFARRARYGVWQEQLQPGEVLLQAHHMQDQAETLLLRIARGSPNLQGMPQLRLIEQHPRDFSPAAMGEQLSSPSPNQGLSVATAAHQEAVNLSKLAGLGSKVRGKTICAVIGRPLLRIDKGLINDYAEYHKIEYIEDESNLDTKIERNFIRHKILPQLQQQWPSIINSVAKSAERLSGYEELIQERQQQLLAQFVQQDGAAPPSLDLSQGKHKIMAGLPAQDFELLIQGWLGLCGVSPPNSSALSELQRQLKNNEQAGIHWQQGEIRRRRSHLHALHPA